MEIDFLSKILMLSFLIISNIYFFYFFTTNNYYLKVNFLREIAKEFNENGKINLNEVELRIMKNNNSNISNIINQVIHIGFTLNSKYILETMITITSIMATQKNSTKIIFHLGVVHNFTAQNMTKIYELRKKINNLTEFNFYYLKGAMKKMKNFHPKGEACPGKFELPELLPDYIVKLLLFDAGDVLIFRDLSELYNYDMKNFWVLGPPEPHGIYLNRKYSNNSKYVNIGSILLNVKALKEIHFWDIYTNNRKKKCFGMPDQSLFNILVPDNKKNYFPFRFGGLMPFESDNDSDILKYFSYGFKYWINSKLSESFPENPKTLDGMTAQLYNSHFIHQWNGKWYNGKGLSLFRLLAKYFIKLAGIWEEVCLKKPGYCK